MPMPLRVMARSRFTSFSVCRYTSGASFFDSASKYFLPLPAAHTQLLCIHCAARLLPGILLLLGRIDHIVNIILQFPACQFFIEFPFPGTKRPAIVTKARISPVLWSKQLFCFAVISDRDHINALHHTVTLPFHLIMIAIPGDAQIGKAIFIAQEVTQFF